MDILGKKSGDGLLITLVQESNQSNLSFKPTFPRPRWLKRTENAGNENGINFKKTH